MAKIIITMAIIVIVLFVIANLLSRVSSSF